MRHITLAVLVVAWIALPAGAQTPSVPEKIGFQGRLTDASGGLALSLVAQAQPLSRGAMKAELAKWMNEYRETLGTKEIEQLAGMGDLFQAAVDIMRDAEAHLPGADYRLSMSIHVLSEIRDPRVRGIFFPYLTCPSSIRLVDSDSIYADPRWAYAKRYMISTGDKEGELILRRLLEDPSRDINDKLSILGSVEAHGGSHWIAYLRQYEQKDVARSDRSYLLTLQNAIRTLEVKYPAVKGAGTPSRPDQKGDPLRAAPDAGSRSESAPPSPVAGASAAATPSNEASPGPEGSRGYRVAVAVVAIAILALCGVFVLLRRARHR